MVSAEVSEPTLLEGALDVRHELVGAVADQFMAHIKSTLEEGRFADLG